MSGERVFKTYPTHAQLAEMDRDLEFHPTTNAHPRVLSREQIAHYNREGYITGLNELRAGQCSIHSDLLLHGSEANDSDRRRCGLTLRYCTPDVRGALGRNNKGIVVRGRDPDNHWGNPPRPLRDYDGV